MKKAYETPVAEKLAFNYRDQVVAASGGIADNPADGNPSLEDVIKYLLDAIGICQYFQ